MSFPTHSSEPVDDHALNLLATLSRHEAAARHPSMCGPTVAAASARLHRAGLADRGGSPTNLGAEIGTTISTATTFMQLHSSRPAHRQLWLRERRAVLAERATDGGWLLRSSSRSGLWQLFLGWLQIDDRPAPPRRPTIELDVPSFTGEVHRQVLRGAAPTPNTRSAAVRARCWHLEVSHTDAGQSTRRALAALDAGVSGWWCGSRSGQRPRTMRLIPTDTHDVWRGVAAALDPTSVPAQPMTATPGPTPR